MEKSYLARADNYDGEEDYVIVSSLTEAKREVKRYLREGYKRVEILCERDSDGRILYTLEWNGTAFIKNNWLV